METRGNICRKKLNIGFGVRSHKKIPKHFFNYGSFGAIQTQEILRLKK